METATFICGGQGSGWRHAFACSSPPAFRFSPRGQIMRQSLLPPRSQGLRRAETPPTEAMSLSQTAMVTEDSPLHSSDISRRRSSLLPNRTEASTSSASASAHLVQGRAAVNVDSIDSEMHDECAEGHMASRSMLASTSASVTTPTSDADDRPHALRQPTAAFHPMAWVSPSVAAPPSTVSHGPTLLSRSAERLPPEVCGQPPSIQLGVSRGRLSHLPHRTTTSPTPWPRNLLHRAGPASPHALTHSPLSFPQALWEEDGSDDLQDLNRENARWT